MLFLHCARLVHCARHVHCVRPREALGVIAAALVLLLLAPPTPAGADDMTRQITVSAEGSVSAVPDAARIHSGVQTSAPSAQAALAENSKLMSNLVDGLKAMGVDPRDIQTASFNVQPQYQHNRDGTPPDVTGYQVVNEVNVLLRDIEKVGATLDKMIQLGANQVRGLDFEVLDSEKLSDEARKEAMANARRRAEVFAAAAGARIGKVLEIREGGGSNGGPRPMLEARRASAVPIEAGEEVLSVAVTVTWALD